MEQSVYVLSQRLNLPLNDHSVLFLRLVMEEWFGEAPLTESDLETLFEYLQSSKTAHSNVKPQEWLYYEHKKRQIARIGTLCFQVEREYESTQSLPSTVDPHLLVQEINQIAIDLLNLPSPCREELQRLIHDIKSSSLLLFGLEGLSL
jgi:hypothetical protein